MSETFTKRTVSQPVSGAYKIEITVQSTVGNPLGGGALIEGWNYLEETHSFFFVHKGMEVAEFKAPQGFETDKFVCGLAVARKVDLRRYKSVWEVMFLIQRFLAQKGFGQEVKPQS